MASEIHPVARLPREWQSLLAERGERGFRGTQVFRWIHERGVFDPDAMSNLPKELRSLLREEGLDSPLAVERVHRSADGTRKLLVKMADGSTVETVLLPVTRPGLRDDADAAAAEDEHERDAGFARVTQCISTQVGCAMGCVFCASGVAGLKRNMTAAEIVGQLLAARDHLEDGEALRHVVFMGMGEPLHNYEETARAIRLMTNPHGLALSPRRITVSTSGLVPEIDRLGADFTGRVGLAVSLHAADDERRSALVPVNRRYPLRELIAALARYPIRRRRRITIEYTLIRGQNDAPADAHKLARLLRGLRVKLNLIPMNPIEHSKLAPPEQAGVLAFQEILTRSGYTCFVRRRRGDDVSAACGQLVLLDAKPTRRFAARQPRGS